MPAVGLAVFKLSFLLAHMFWVPNVAPKVSQYTSITVLQNALIPNCFNLLLASLIPEFVFPFLVACIVLQSRYGIYGFPEI